MSAACGSGRTGAPPVENTTPPAAFSTVLSSAGVGPLGSDTPDDRDAIARLVPGLTVTLSENVAEDHEIHEYTAAQGERRVLFVVINASSGPTPRVFRIDVHDRLFATATGIGVGSTIGALAAKHPDTACRFARYDPAADIYRVDRRLYCEAGSLPHLAFDLDPTDWREAPAQIPVARLAARKIHEITWLNPAEPR